MGTPNAEPRAYCPGCNRYADQIPECIDMAKADLSYQTPEDVAMDDGTYNRVNGHFLCTECYINAGMPSSPTGWVCP